MHRKLNYGVAILFVSVLAVAQTGSKAEKTGNAEPASGKQLYNTYCALCHGTDGKGGGPFAPQLKVWPPDLTQLAKKNQGVFPAMHLEEAIDGEFGRPAHGSAQMPIWGPVFRSMAHGHKDSAQVKIDNLVKYVESIQEK